MFGWTHELIVLFYTLLPVVAIAWALWLVLRRPRTREPIGILLTLVLGTVAGMSGALVYAQQANGQVSWSQMLLASWFATSMLLLLKLGDRLLAALLRPLVWRRQPDGTLRRRWWIGSATFMVRVLVLFTVALPLMFGSLLVYRPPVQHAQTPANAGLMFEQVRIPTEDGLLLRGWWIPAQSADDQTVEPSSRTVIVCHGFGTSAEGALPLTQQLVPYGYNVLMFDFRAHGFSDGNLSGFGALESRDVLAAARWLHAIHPQESVELYGAGVGLGAAALVNAAADPSQTGQAFQALTLYAPYASLEGLLHDSMTVRVPAPVRWLLQRAAVSVASLTAGARLWEDAPIRQITQVWPRPVLLVHGLRDGLIPFSQGEALFDAAAQPRQRLWLLRDNHAQTLTDPMAGLRMRLFFDSARPVPII